MDISTETNKAKATSDIWKVLLVLSAPQYNSEGQKALLINLSQQSQTIVATDGGVAYLREAGIVPDIVIGDFDSLQADDHDFLDLHSVKTYRYPEDKDQTDTALALEHIENEAQKRHLHAEVTLTATHGGRADHEFAIWGECVRHPNLAPRIEECEFSAQFLFPSTKQYRVGAPGNTTISLLALIEPLNVTTQGLKWNLNQFSIEPLSSLGISNVVEDGNATLVVHSGSGVMVVVNEASQ